MEVRLMKKLSSALVLIGSIVSVHAAFAAERTVSFAVENMTCASCPYIVKRSMASMPGVLRVDVSFETKAATVTFDGTKTTADAIAAASTNAGYPARLQQGS
jgi:mercuric ion binding protein